MSNIRLGIVGLGRLGKIHAMNISKHIPGATLTAACSIVEEELEFARNELGVKETYITYEEMVASPNLDAVCIVSPSGFHTEQIRLAMEKGLHVFSEKPIGLELEDIEKTVEIINA